MTDVTRILHAIGQGDQRASDELLPLVYDELKRLAAARMSHERSDHTLQATALVHEAYLRLVGSESDSQWDSLAHFYSAAAEAMRRILIDEARRRRSLRHGGEFQRRPLEKIDPSGSGPANDVLAIDEALTKLAEQHPEKAKLVKLRFFAGLTIAEAAKMLGIAESTADRHWTFARAWLHRELMC